MTPNVTVVKPRACLVLRILIVAAILVVLNIRPACAQIAQISYQEFYNKVLDASYKKPVIVMFSSKSCGACKILEPVLADATTRYRKITTYKVYTSQARPLADHYNVTGVPTTLAFYKAYADVLMEGFAGSKKVYGMVEQVYTKSQKVY